jgi:hypothetical protein
MSCSDLDIAVVTNVYCTSVRSLVFAVFVAVVTFNLTDFFLLDYIIIIVVFINLHKCNFRILISEVTL